ncbi:MAG: hypothetical protein IH602_13130 [Bryobacteraceae bacterium]|nr:hypothetical protein [Bryobacteraceae bacterium]
MNETLLKMIVPAIGLISGLVATYVSLQNRALLAEVRRELAEMENRVILRLNGNYVRRRECELLERNMHERVESLAQRVRETDSHGN